MEAYALRFALICHVLRHLDAAKDRPIGVGDMSNAIRLVRWTIREAERVYQLLSPGRPNASSGSGLGALLTRVRSLCDDEGGLTVQMLQNSNSRMYPTAADARAALDKLAAAGLGRWEKRGQKGGHWTKDCFVPHPE